MDKVSVMFDAPARSGNHLAVATLADSFPDIKFYWGYPNQHSPKSFALPKEKAKHILTVLRNPLDSLVSVVVVCKPQTPSRSPLLILPSQLLLSTSRTP